MNVSDCSISRMDTLRKSVVAELNVLRGFTDQGTRGVDRLILCFFSSRRRHTRCSRDWSSDVCSADLIINNGKKKLEDIALVELNTDKHNFSNQRKTPCNVKAKRTDWRSHHIYPAIGEVAKIIRDDMLPAVIKSENWDMQIGRAS